MAQLTFPIVRAGLALDVLVNLEASKLIQQWTGGLRPSPISGKALIDTGSDISAVSQRILRQLAVPIVRNTSTMGIAGSMKVALYRVGMHIYDARNHSLPWFSQLSLTVMELPQKFPFDALVGMDVIRTCKLLVDGPAGTFTLEF